MLGAETASANAGLLCVFQYPDSENFIEPQQDVYTVLGAARDLGEIPTRTSDKW